MNITCDFKEETKKKFQNMQNKIDVVIIPHRKSQHLHTCCPTLIWMNFKVAKQHVQQSTREPKVLIASFELC